MIEIITNMPVFGRVCSHDCRLITVLNVAILISSTPAMAVGNHIRIQYMVAQWDNRQNLIESTVAAPPGNGFIIHVGEQFMATDQPGEYLRPVYFLTNSHVWFGAAASTDETFSTIRTITGDAPYVMARIEVVDSSTGQCLYRNSLQRFHSINVNYSAEGRGFKLLSSCWKDGNVQSSSGLKVKSGAVCDYSLVRMLVPTESINPRTDKYTPIKVSAYPVNFDSNPLTANTLWVQNGARGLRSSRKPIELPGISALDRFEIEHKGTTYSIKSGWSGSPVLDSENKAVGILFAGTESAGGTGFAYHIHDIYKYLDVENEIAKDLRTIRNSKFPEPPANLGDNYDQRTGYCGQ